LPAIGGSIHVADWTAALEKFGLNCTCGSRATVDWEEAVLQYLSRLTLMGAGALALSVGNLSAAEGIGEALAVIDQASAIGTVGQRPLAAGEKVFLGERVKTDDIGEVQILFGDGTRMVVGPNSDMMLDEYVFRAGTAENQFVVRAFNGAFRFITGNSEKDAYLIQTPSATIGVRGTVFDFAVTPDNTNLLLMHGGVNVCGNDFGCTRADVE
jgi:hypothetical protein